MIVERSVPVMISGIPISRSKMLLSYPTLAEHPEEEL